MEFNNHIPAFTLTQELLLEELVHTNIIVKLLIKFKLKTLSFKVINSRSKAELLIVSELHKRRKRQERFTLL